MSNDDEVWIYHERQEALLCGQHALNNLVQDAAFTAGDLAEIAHQLDQLELAYMAANNEGGVRSKEYIQRVAEGSANVDPSGNFSIQVLRAALQQRYNLELPSLLQDDMKGKEVTDMIGFICHRADHWFALRKIGNRYFWNLNSTLEKPVQISHFRLAAELQGLQDSGYSVFCVPDGLPTTGTKRDFVVASHSAWWSERELLGGEAQSQTNPWEGVGSGMRLDGKGGEMSEEDMLQMALAASLQKPMDAELTPEPPVGADGVLRIQFRLPNKSRAVVRRFLATDPVPVVYAFAKSACDGRDLELRYGFPPKDLTSVADKTLGEASLGGESIQGRYV